MTSVKQLRRSCPVSVRNDYEQVLEDTPVGRIMTREPFTVTESTSIVDAVSVLVEKKFESLPVVAGTEIVGIFTEIDALKILLGRLNGG